jgi:hypothetical protein
MRSRLLAWFFPALSDVWLTSLRVGLGAQLVLFAITTRGDWLRLLNSSSRHISEAILAAQSPWIPRISWFIRGGSAIGLGEEQTLDAIWWSLLVAALFLLVGLFCRPTAIAAWLLHLAVVKSGSIFSYGADGFTTIALFYLAISPLPDSHSLDRWLRKIPACSPQLHGFFQRVLQLHLCLIYFFSGLSKALGTGWWNGENLWRAMTHPPFDILDPNVLAGIRPLFPAVGISIWLLEIGYAIFIWPRPTRAFWLCGIIVMHMGIGVLMGMPLFGLIMLVLNIAAFAPGMADQFGLATSAARPER